MIIYEYQSQILLYICMRLRRSRLCMPPLCIQGEAHEARGTRHWRDHWAPIFFLCAEDPDSDASPQADTRESTSSIKKYIFTLTLVICAWPGHVK